MTDVNADAWATGRSAYELADAVGFGVSAADLDAWAPCSPLDVHWARKHGLDVSTVRRWLTQGVNVQDAVRAQLAGVGLDEVVRWVQAGFAASDAAVAAEASMSLDEARVWREVGFILPDAALLRQDGWTLEHAAAARIEGLDPHGRWSDKPRTGGAGRDR
jgi:hypothetical protein